MKKRIANGIELVFLIASFIILLIPCITVANSVDTIVTSVYTSKVSAIDLVSRFALTNIPMQVLFILCFVMCIISIISKRVYKDGIIHCILPIILFIHTNYCVATCTAGLEMVSTDFPVAIFEFCLFAVIVLSFVKRSALIVGLPEIKVSENAVSNADELKKYKDLLDSGAITQAEFDEKKRQLLGL